LISVIDRATILGDGERLEVAAALGGGVIGAGRRPSSLAASPPSPLERTRMLSLDAMAKQHIEHALTATGGRVEGPRGAAALLQINPHTLRARMRKLGIDWAGFRQALRQDDIHA
jgi:hydrogenase-4 transcriptional activator